MSDDWGDNGEYMPEYLHTDHWYKAKELADAGVEGAMAYWMEITGGTGKFPWEEWQEEQSPLSRAIEKIAVEAEWQSNGPSRDGYYAMKYLKEHWHMEHQLRRFLPADDATQGLWDFLNPPNELPKRGLMGWSEA